VPAAPATVGAEEAVVVLIEDAKLAVAIAVSDTHDSTLSVVPCARNKVRNAAVR
jgi:hypothetical protein